MIWLGEALFWKYLIIDIPIYLSISIFFSHFDRCKKCDTGFGCTYAAAVALWTDISVLGLYLGWERVSELLPQMFSALFGRNMRFIFFSSDTVHCKLYSLNSSNTRTTFLFLHGQTETERTWAAHLISSVIPSYCGILLITCVLTCIWSFSCFCSSLVLHFWTM